MLTFNSEAAAEALVELRTEGRFPEGVYFERLWDLGLIASVARWEAEPAARHDGTGHQWAITDRGQRYIDFYLLEV